MSNHIKLKSDIFHLCKTKVAIIIIGIAIFTFVSVAIKLGYTYYIDNLFREFGYSIRNRFTKGLIIPITYMGNATIIVSVILSLILIPTTRRDIGVPAAITGILGFGIYKILKNFFARPRPDSLYFLIEQGGYSFPSGHSMNGLICYGIIIFLLLRTYGKNINTITISVILGILIFLIGFSRIFVGVHYITDVIGGWSLGISYVTAASLFIEKMDSKRKVIS